MEAANTGSVVLTPEGAEFFRAAEQSLDLVPTLFGKNLAPGADLYCPFDSNVASAGEYCFLCPEETAVRPEVAGLIDWFQTDARGLA